LAPIASTLNRLINEHSLVSVSESAYWQKRQGVG